MPSLQHYKGRHYKVEEVLEVLGVLFGSISVAELNGSSRSFRYPETWKRRALIKACRAAKSESASGLGFGPDWRGVLNPSPSRPYLEKPQTSYPLKQWILDFERTGNIPLMALARACPLILRRDEEMWLTHSIESRKRSVDRILVAAE